MKIYVYGVRFHDIMKFCYEECEVTETTALYKQANGQLIPMIARHQVKKAEAGVIIPGAIDGASVFYNKRDDAAARKILHDYFINRYNRKKSEADLELERANCVVGDPFPNKSAANRG